MAKAALCVGNVLIAVYVDINSVCQTTVSVSIDT